jgi:hypothetical protein
MGTRRAQRVRARLRSGAAPQRSRPSMRRHRPVTVRRPLSACPTVISTRHGRYSAGCTREAIKWTPRPRPGIGAARRDNCRCRPPDAWTCSASVSGRRRSTSAVAPAASTAENWAVCPPPRRRIPNSSSKTGPHGQRRGARCQPQNLRGFAPLRLSDGSGAMLGMPSYSFGVNRAARRREKARRGHPDWPMSHRGQPAKLLSLRSVANPRHAAGRFTCASIWSFRSSRTHLRGCRHYCATCSPASGAGGTRHGRRDIPPFVPALPIDGSGLLAAVFGGHPRSVFLSAPRTKTLAGLSVATTVLQPWSFY